MTNPYPYTSIEREVSGGGTPVRRTVACSEWESDPDAVVAIAAARSNPSAPTGACALCSNAVVSYSLDDHTFWAHTTDGFDHAPEVH